VIDHSRPDYGETLSQIGELKDMIENVEKNLVSQVSQDIVNPFVIAKDRFVDWLEEAEFTISNYKHYD